MNVYAKASNKRLAELTEAVNGVLLLDSPQPAHNRKQQT